MTQGEFNWTGENRLPRLEPPEKGAVVPVMPGYEAPIRLGIKYVKNARLQAGGCRCPCCNKHVQTYERKLNRTMAASLQWIVWESGSYLRWGGWVNVPNSAPSWLLKSNQHTTLAWWGLIERRLNDDPTKKSSGTWRPTEKGIQFASGKISVPEAVYTEDGVPVGYSTKEIRIYDRLGNFNHGEVMGASVFPDSLVPLSAVRKGKGREG